MATFSEGDKSFGIDRGCSTLKLPTLISSNDDVVTRQEISISLSNASYALWSPISASVPGSHSCSPTATRVVYGLAVSMMSS